jgi:hypothetical protein
MSTGILIHLRRTVTASFSSFFDQSLTADIFQQHTVRQFSANDRTLCDVTILTAMGSSPSSSLFSNPDYRPVSRLELFK